MQTSHKNEILGLISHKKYYLKIKKELLQRIQRREIVKLRRKKEYNEDEEYMPAKEDLISTGKAILKSGGNVAKEFHLIIQNALKLFECKIQNVNLNFPEKGAHMVAQIEKRRASHSQVLETMNRKYIDILNKEFALRKETFTKVKGAGVFQESKRIGLAQD